METKARVFCRKQFIFVRTSSPASWITAAPRMHHWHCNFGADVPLHSDSLQTARAQMIHQCRPTASPQEQPNAVPSWSTLRSQSTCEILCPWSSSRSFHSRSEMCNLAQSTTILKKEEYLRPISTKHVLGIKGLEVREGKGKSIENSLICGGWHRTSIKWGKERSQQVWCFYIGKERGSCCEAEDGTWKITGVRRSASAEDHCQWGESDRSTEGEQLPWSWSCYSFTA